MDKEKFTRLVRKEQEPLRRVLLALCLGDRALADDLAQEALVKAYLSCGGFRDEGKFGAWLYRIAYHTFLDHQRSLRPTAPLDRAGGMAGETDSDGAFRYEALYAALAGLPGHERTALLLFYIKGYQVREIAAIMECSEDAVKKQLQRGREHLKLKLGKER